MPYQIELDVSLVKMFALLIFKNLWKHKISINKRSIILLFYFFEMNIPKSSKSAQKVLKIFDLI